MLRGFLGLIGYYRKFIKKDRKISAPLTSLLKKDAFQRLYKATTVFDKLKVVMTIMPVLALLDFSKTFVIEADASGVRIGVVLM